MAIDCVLFFINRHIVCYLDFVVDRMHAFTKVWMFAELLKILCGLSEKAHVLENATHFCF